MALMEWHLRHDNLVIMPRSSNNVGVLLLWLHKQDLDPVVVGLLAGVVTREVLVCSSSVPVPLQTLGDTAPASTARQVTDMF